ncbi:MAG: hypothetical protein ABFD54_10465 [Armatimonadota bacterium]|nr:hypothetical protein [bacterium]
MIQPVWKLISLLVGLGVFLAVGVSVWLAEEDLVWVIGKAIGSFFICWIVLGQMGGMLLSVLGKQDSDPGNEPGNVKLSGNEKG